MDGDRILNWRIKRRSNYPCSEEAVAFLLHIVVDDTRNLGTINHRDRKLLSKLPSQNQKTDFHCASHSLGLTTAELTNADTNEN